MTRLIDADKVTEAISWLKEYDFIIWHDVIEYINKLPTVDAEPVVRCKDCRHYLEDGWGYGNCGRPNVDYLRMSEHDYCSKGEKR